MKCDKCNETMAAASTWRFGIGLVVTGFCVLVPSLLAMGAGVLLGVLALVTGGKASSDIIARDNAKAAAQLKAAAPSLSLDEFRRTGYFDRAKMAKLTEAERAEVEKILARRPTNSAEHAGVGIGMMMIAGVGLVPFVLGVIGLVAALVMLRRKKMWRCPCGFAAERL